MWLRSGSSATWIPITQTNKDNQTTRTEFASFYLNNYSQNQRIQATWLRESWAASRRVDRSSMYETHSAVSPDTGQRENSSAFSAWRRVFTSMNDLTSIAFLTALNSTWVSRWGSMRDRQKLKLFQVEFMSMYVHREGRSYTQSLHTPFTMNLPPSAVNIDLVNRSTKVRLQKTANSTATTSKCCKPFTM